MSDTNQWSFPPSLQPKQDDLQFDLGRAMNAVVGLRAEVPEDAFTASILGTDRAGSGVVIREDGLVLTIGYLVTEAASIWLTTTDGRVVPGHPLAFDFASGFGLVMPLGKLDAPALQRGSTAALGIGDDAFVLGQGGRAHALKARVIAKREFAGYWEYVLDEALFTAPAHPQWGGAALLGADGRLAGIGSLFVQETVDGEEVEANMFVPIDLLEPILDDLLKQGRRAGAVRPWLGMYTAEVKGQLVVNALVRNGPADRAGVKLGDAVVEVAGQRVLSLADLFRRVWRLGAAGAEIPLSLARKGAPVAVRVRSGDRADYLKKPQLH
ncbi:MAG: S1C family serine protease [Burkholderiales bacterium]|jgi:S1-C subfamily serine protease|nr:S1C family serine protease [Burkholderiales bacterium]